MHSYQINPFFQIPAVTWSTSDQINATLSNGNLTCSLAGGIGSCNVTTAFGSGKRYFEVHVDAVDGSGNTFIGIQAQGQPTSGGTQNLVSWGWCYASSGAVEDHGSLTASYSSWTAGDVVGVAVDFGAGSIWFAKNGTWVTGNPALGTTPVYSDITAGNWCAAIGKNTLTTVGGTARFSAAAMGYTIPTGFSAWGAP